MLYNLLVIKIMMSSIHYFLILIKIKFIEYALKKSYAMKHIKKSFKKKKGFLRRKNMEKLVFFYYFHFPLFKASFYF